METESLEKLSIYELVLELSSNRSPEQSDHLVKKIIYFTHVSFEFENIAGAILSRIHDCSGRNWRHGYKSINLLKRLVVYGSDQVLTFVLDHIQEFRSLAHFSHKDAPVEANMRKMVGTLLQIALDYKGLYSKRKQLYPQTESLDTVLIEEPVLAQTASVASEDTISTSRLSDFFIEKVQSYEEEKFEDEQFRIAFEKFAKYREKSAIRNKGPLLPEFSALHKSFRPLQ